jgi:hypothetical protein
MDRLEVKAWHEAIQILKDAWSDMYASDIRVIDYTIADKALNNAIEYVYGNAPLGYLL